MIICFILGGALLFGAGLWLGWYYNRPITREIFLGKNAPRFGENPGQQ